MASVYHLLSRQIPAHIQQQYPVFCKFIEYYYRWLQTCGFVSLQDVQNIDSTTTAITVKDSTTDIKNYLHHTISNGTALAEVVGIDQDRLIVRYLTADATFENDDQIHIRANSDDNYTDEQYRNLDVGTIANVETLPSAFIDRFSKLLDADQIFSTQTPNIATILRHIRQLYQSKGNEQALKYLIKALKGVDVEIQYPWERVLKFSDGKWKRQYCITVRSDERYWHYVPLNMKTIRLMYNETDDAGNQRYRDVPITRIEIFAKQHENYDQSARADLPPFIYDIPENGFDNGYWMSIIDVESLIRFTYDMSNAGFDTGVWLDDSSETGDIFENEVNQFDEFGPYWIRDEHPELGPYEIDPTTGAIIFEDPKAQCTYGRWGYRHVTPFIRFYFDEDVDATLDQEVRVIETNDKGEQYVSYVGNVVLSVDHVDVINKGKGWQVGQIFTSSKDDLWYIYSEPVDIENQRSVTLINQDSVAIEYSINKPLIGRVLTIDENGGIDTVEILQYGDHIPEHGGKIFTVSPLFYHDPDIDETEYQAQLELKYSENAKGVGYFDDPSGFLSYSDIRIQDSDYWQQFSYDIIANVDGDQYANIAQLLHPVGTKMFTTYMVENNLDADLEFEVEQTYPFVSISLFEVAYAVEKLEKDFIKIVNDQITIDEFLEKIFTKPLPESANINDGHNDNTLTYQLELNYDSGREDIQWSERTVDVDKKVKTSYVDSGYKKLVHVNYDYHIIDDFPQNPQPPIQSGGYIKLVDIDGLVFDKSSNDDFYQAGTLIEYQWTIGDITRYTSIGILVYRHSDGTEVESQYNYDRLTGIYTASFEMPDDDVVVQFLGETLRYRIITDQPEHGSIQCSKMIGYQGDLVTVTTTPENNQWTLGSLFYHTERLGTVYITKTKQFNIPNEHVTVGGEFVSNGGMIHVESNGGGTITWNVDINEYVIKDTVVTFTINVDEIYELSSVVIVNSDGTTTVIDNNQFVMPSHDIIIRFTFARQKRSLTSEIVYEGVEPQRYRTGKFTHVPYNVTGQYEIGTHIDYQATVSDNFSEITQVAKTVGDNTDIVAAQGSFDITDNTNFVVTVSQSGGYILKEYDGSDSWVTSNVVLDRDWIRYRTPVTLTFAQRTGYNFIKALGFREDMYTYQTWFNAHPAGINDPSIKKYLVEYDQHVNQFTMPRYSIAIVDIEYQPIEYQCTVRVVGEGTVTLDPNTNVIPYNQLVTIQPNPTNRWRVKKISYVVEGTEYDVTKDLYFSMPSADIELVCEFEYYSCIISVDSTTNGTIQLTDQQNNPISDLNNVVVGTVVLVRSIPDAYFKLSKLTITKSDGSIVDIIDSQSFVVDGDITVTGAFVRSTHTLTVNPVVSSSSITYDDAYDRVLKQTRVVVAHNVVHNGPYYGQQPTTSTFNDGTVVNVSLETVKLDHPTSHGFACTCQLTSVTVTDQNGRSTNYNVTNNNIDIFLESENYTITGTVTKQANVWSDTFWIDIDVVNNVFQGSDADRTLFGMTFTSMRQRDDTNIYWKGSYTGGGGLQNIYISTRSNHNRDNFAFNSGGWSDGRITPGKYNTQTGRARISINRQHPLMS